MYYKDLTTRQIIKDNDEIDCGNFWAKASGAIGKRVGKWKVRRPVTTPEEKFLAKHGQLAIDLMEKLRKKVRYFKLDAVPMPAIFKEVITDWKKKNYE